MKKLLVVNDLDPSVKLTAPDHVLPAVTADEFAYRYVVFVPPVGVGIFSVTLPVSWRVPVYDPKYVVNVGGIHTNVLSLAVTVCVSTALIYAV